MICPNCNNQMVPIERIPFRWVCINHEPPLYIQEPYPTNYTLMGTSTNTVDAIREEEERIGRLWTQKLLNHPRTCPACRTELEYNHELNQWECHQYEPVYILPAREITEQDTTTSPIRAFDIVPNTTPLTDQLPRIVQSWADVFLNDTNQRIEEQQGSIPVEKTEMNILTLREQTEQWFDPMPKALKLMYIETNPDAVSVMHNYKEWDVKAITYNDMMSSTQRILREHFKQLRP